MGKSAITIQAILEGKPITAIIDTKYSGVIVSKCCINNLGLIADSQIDFIFNTAVGTTEKQHLIFEKVKIIVGKHSVQLPVIVMNKGYFDVLLEVNWIKKIRAELDFN